MRVAIIAESFLPAVNGVANSVRQIIDELRRSGHQALVVAPGPGPRHYGATPVVRTRAIPLPFYRDFTIGIAHRRLAASLGDFGPDVVHLASPTVLGALGSTAARELGIPAVSVFQTDVARFATHYGYGWVGPAAWRFLRRVHNRTAVTLAPTRSVAVELRSRGFRNVMIWGRGVDGDAFHPCHRDDELRARLAPNGERLIGYVGRLAPEKRVDLLRTVEEIGNTRLVIVGDGPARAQLERALPDALFTGFKSGDALSRLYASFDVFVHTGTAETFGQTVQEALASGVPVIAPAVGGPRDLISPGVNGWLWNPAEPTEIRDLVARVLADPGMRVRVSIRARRSVEHRSWRRVCEELLDHYSFAIRREKARAA